jgi:hypothetical protein
MKVRFRNPESSAGHQGDAGVGPAKRPHVPAWRWYLLVLLISTLFLIGAGRLFFNLLSPKGSGYLIYQTQELTAPVSLDVQQVLVSDGARVSAGAPLLRGRIRSQSPDTREALSSGELVLAAPSGGVAEQVRVRQGQRIAADAAMLAIRAEAPPFVQAWMSVDLMNGLWVGRQAQVRLPDGSWHAAVITHVLASTERLPEGLSDSGRPGPSSLAIRLRLQEGLQTQQINFLPVEVRLRWRDDFSQWMRAMTESLE